MKISTRSRYAVRLLLDLARHQDQGPVQIGDIAKRQDISVKYLEQLIRPLKSAELIFSLRGAKGGHRLSVAPKKITLGQVVRLLEGQTELVACDTDPDICSRSDDCRVRLVWQAACRAMYKELDSISIADLMIEEELAKSGAVCPAGGSNRPEKTRRSSPGRRRFTAASSEKKPNKN